MSEQRPLRSLSDLLREVIQVAYVTDDLEAGVEWLQTTFGATKCRTMYASSLGGSVVVDGRPAEEWVIDAALVNAGPTNLALIRPVSGALGRGAFRPVRRPARRVVVCVPLHGTLGTGCRRRCARRWRTSPGTFLPSATGHPTPSGPMRRTP